jgi:hypothetical protein
MLCMTYGAILCIIATSILCYNTINHYHNRLQWYQPLGDAQGKFAAEVSHGPPWRARFSEAELQVLSNFRTCASCDPRRATIHPEQHTRSIILSMALVRQDEELVIKPEAVAPNVNYADWPLLLKNWDQRMSLHQPVIGRAV